MASIHDCLDRALAAGEIESERAEAAKSLYDQLVERYENSGMPPHKAAARAADDLREATRKSARARHHAVLNQMIAIRRAKQFVDAAKDPTTLPRHMIEYSPRSDYKGETVVAVQRALIQRAQGRLGQFLQEHHRNILGRATKGEGLLDVWRELHGTKTGNEKAEGFAKVYDEAREELRREFNAYGGDIGKIENYGVRQSHNAQTLRKLGFERWSRDIADGLAWHRIEDHQTGRPFADEGGQPNLARAEEFLREIYKNITTESWEKTDPVMGGRGTALYNRRSDPRILHFKDADAALEYNKIYGESDVFGALIGGIEAMARDVAQMRVLGPNPEMTLDYIGQLVAKKVSDDGGKLKAAKKEIAWAKAMLDQISGGANTPMNEAAARFFSGTRNLLTFMQLGSATLSATTDLTTIRVAARASGLNPNGATMTHLKLLFSKREREEAAQLGLVADTLMDAGSTAARYIGEGVAPEFTSRAASAILRVSLNSHWTDMGRLSFKKEFLAEMARNAAHALDDIPDASFRELLKSRGITAKDWEALSEAEALFEPRPGVRFWSFRHWLEQQTSVESDLEAQGLVTRILSVMEERQNFAVPTVSIEAQARVRLGTKPGSIPGEFMASGLQYKSYPMTVMINFYRLLAGGPVPINRAEMGVRLATGMILMGALAVQLKEMSKGRDPRPMDDEVFLAAAVLQSGGLGIFGDFFAAKQNRFGGGFAQTAAGPAVNLADDLGDLTLAPAMRWWNGENPNFGRELGRTAARYFPDTWYSHLAFDRMVADHVQRILDPDAEQLAKRAERDREKDYGNATFWNWGEPAPSRLPDLSNALGDLR